MKNLLVIILCVLFAFPVCAADQVAKFGWSKSPETVVTGYQLYRATTSTGPYTSVGAVVPQVVGDVEVTTQDTIPYVPGTSYYYIVRAISDHAVSGASNEVDVISLSIPILHVKVQVLVDVQ